MAARTRIAAIEGLRACAALSVLTYHVANLAGRDGSGVLETVLAQARAGVTLFFVISGFVLFLPYARSHEGLAPAPALGRYLGRRAARILPAYWVVLAAWLAVSAAAGPAGSRPAADWIADAALVQAYSPHLVFSGLGPAWSLCVEAAFYLALPLIARGLAGCALRSRLLIIGLAAVVSVALRVGITGSPAAGTSPRFVVLATSLPGLFDWFAVGLALATVTAAIEAGRPRFEPVRRLAGRPLLCGAGALALFAASVPLQGSPVILTLESPLAHVMLGAAAGLLLLPTVVPRSRPRDRPARMLAALSSPLATRLGTYSYGIFLVNVPVGAALVALARGGPLSPYPAAVLPWGQTVALLIACGALSVGLGALSWHLVERPAMRRLGGRRTDRRAEVTPIRSSPAACS